MSKPPPPNALDRALQSLCRSPSAAPDFYRALLAGDDDGDLWLLVRYHPEIEDATLKLENGAPFPFVQLREKKRNFVPMFASEGRLREGLKRSKAPPRAYSAACLPARQALEVLGAMDLPAVLNKSCTGGEIWLPPDLLRDLASGEVLRPHAADSSREQGTVKILDPAEYPTAAVQPSFEILRRHPPFRVAWIFGRGEPTATDADKRRTFAHYQMLLVMQPRDEVVLHELRMVLASCRQETDVNIGLLDEGDAAYLAEVFRQARPFYIAVDYPVPPGARA